MKDMVDSADKKLHRKKKIAPVVVTVIAVLYYAIYFGLMIASLPTVWKWVLGTVPLILGVATVYVCVQRIREIDGGEEDDLGKY